MEQKHGYCVKLMLRCQNTDNKQQQQQQRYIEDTSAGRDKDDSPDVYENRGDDARRMSNHTQNCHGTAT
jgi:hypothetical protein